MESLKRIITDMIFLDEKKLHERYPRLELTIGEEIKKLRKKCHVTQHELAKYANTYQSCIARIENGYNLPSVFSVKRIMKILKEK